MKLCIQAKFIQICRASSDPSFEAVVSALNKRCYAYGMGDFNRAGLLEVVWAYAMKVSDGFTKLTPVF